MIAAAAVLILVGLMCVVSGVRIYREYGDAFDGLYKTPIGVGFMFIIFAMCFLGAA
jgi:hypothetical protein